jgi:Ala-tRNA(Pro) deacylase
MEPLLEGSQEQLTPLHQVLGRLKLLNVSFRLHSTPEFRTMEDCKRTRPSEIEGVFCKNLLVRDKKKHFFLISALEDTSVDLKSLRKNLDAFRCLTFATEEEMSQKLGMQPGWVNPFGLMNTPNAPDLTYVIDKKILEATLANFHPMDPLYTLTLTTNDLVTFIQHCRIQMVIYDFEKIVDAEKSEK